MNTFRIEIAGEPIPKARARAKRFKGKIMHYDEQQQQKNYISALLLQRICEHPKKRNLFDSARILHVDMEFHLSYPKSFNKRRIIQYNEGSYLFASKPDIDNLAKFYLDCCNKIVFDDDNKVVSLNLKKMYSEKAKTIIEIRSEE